MPYFPTLDERVYRCQGCGEWFYPASRSCLVAHAPGSCCHHYERPAQPRPMTPEPAPTKDSNK